MDHDDVIQRRDPIRDAASMAEPNDAEAAVEQLDHRLTFEAELARAMQIAAHHERDRIVAALRGDAELQVDRTRARAAVESAELRRLAEDDVERIRNWADAEIERIRGEAIRRADERNVDLDTFLQRHDAMIETEVEAVAIAVHQYETTLDQFFVDMTSSIDPAYVVHQADLIPHPPNLETVRATARADAMARFRETDAPTTPEETGAVLDLPKTVGVGVMDPEAISSTSNLAERAEGKEGGPSDRGVATGVDDLSGTRLNAAVRLWRFVASASAPSADNIAPRDR